MCNFLIFPWKKYLKFFFALLVYFSLISIPIFTHVGFIDKNFTVNWITCSLSFSLFLLLSSILLYHSRLLSHIVSFFHFLIRAIFFFSFFKSKHYFRNIKSIFKISIFILSKIKQYFKYKKISARSLYSKKNIAKLNYIQMKELEEFFRDLSPKNNYYNLLSCILISRVFRMFFWRNHSK